MPLDLNQLAPVALWLTVYSDVASNPKVSLPAWLAEERPEAVKFAALPLATYSALVEELRAAREALAFYANPPRVILTAQIAAAGAVSAKENVGSYYESPDDGAKARAALSGGAS